MHEGTVNLQFGEWNAGELQQGRASEIGRLPGRGLDRTLKPAPILELHCIALNPATVRA